MSVSAIGNAAECLMLLAVRLLLFLCSLLQVAATLTLPSFDSLADSKNDPYNDPIHIMIHKIFNLKLATHRHKIYTQGQILPWTDILNYKSL